MPDIFSQILLKFQSKEKFYFERQRIKKRLKSISIIKAQ